MKNWKMQRHRKQPEHIGGKDIDTGNGNMEHTGGVIHQCEADGQQRVKHASDKSVYDELPEHLPLFESTKIQLFFQINIFFNNVL